VIHTLCTQLNRGGGKELINYVFLLSSVPTSFIRPIASMSPFLLSSQRQNYAFIQVFIE